MSYCNIGDKPKVYFQFNNEGQQIYQSNVAPIDVSSQTVPLNVSSQYNTNGYQITFNSPQGAYGQIQIVVVDYQLFTYQGVNYIYGIPCGETSFPAKTPEYGAVITSPVVIDTTVHCPPSNTKKKCNIQVFNSGSVIFQAQGDCPVTFQVACGNCPGGQMESSSPNYPGYCCLDCGSIEGQLSQLINQIKSL